MNITIILLEILILIIKILFIMTMKSFLIWFFLFQNNVFFPQKFLELEDQTLVQKAAGAELFALLLTPDDHGPVPGEHGEDEGDAPEDRVFLRWEPDVELAVLHGGGFLTARVLLLRGSSAWGIQI